MKPATLLRLMALGLCAACGGRSALEPGPSSETNGGNGEVANAGRSTVAGSSARGGTPGMAGSFSTAGEPSVSGSGGVQGGGAANGGDGSGGEAGRCALATGDCRTANRTECMNPLCTGEATYFNRLSSPSEARVVDVATARDGRVAVAGYFEDELRATSSRDGSEEHLYSDANGFDAFVVTFDPGGDLLWSWRFGGFDSIGRQAVTGIDFAPDGELVVQGTTDEDGKPLHDHGFVTRLDTSGNQRWLRIFGRAETFPGDVAVNDNDETLLVGGHADGYFVYREGVLDFSTGAGYLVRIDRDGALVSLRATNPFGLDQVIVSQVVADGEDNWIIAGGGVRDYPYRGFVQKLGLDLEAELSHELSGDGTTWPSGLAVDHQHQITIGGTFFGTTLMLPEGQLDGSPYESAWLVQLDASGKQRWANVITDIYKLETLTVDPFGNIAIAGETRRDLFVAKFRSSGEELWFRHFEASTLLDNMAIAADKDAHLWLGGVFVQSFDWGGSTTQAQGAYDGFLLELSP